MLLVACASAPQPSPVQSADSAAVAASLDRFLRAFERLDWEGFRRAFADDATVFFPSAATPERHDGRAAYEARFRQEFAEIRASAPGGPPFMQLRPVDLEIRVLEPGVATVTFELKNERRHGRRTLVFRREGGEWLIAHVHASNVPWPDQPAGAPAPAPGQLALPGQAVEYLVRSPDLPDTEVRVSEELAYLGLLRYEVPSGARVEAFVFGDTAAGRLRRAFIAHFEGYPDSVNQTFRYPRLEMTRLGAHEYLHQTWALARFSLFEVPAVQALLRRHALTAESSWLVDRYVRVVDSAAKHEVIFFYLEAASLHDASIVYGGAPVAPPPPPAPPAPVTAALRSRAQATFQVRDR